MKKIKAFEVIVDRGASVAKEIRLATSSKDIVMNWNSENGELVRSKEADCPISITSVKNALIVDGFGEQEISIVCDVLRECYDKVIQ